ncbi:MAG: glycosyltransferase [Selenomonadaceae bacterium]|nr:glycosyltransferase [Selenomonadaceae bacterium]
MPFNTYPAVSVVIPMYNAEKYVSACLDSLLVQTLQNFEVIVVDDCSTDSSPAIVESYAEKFGGRLKLAKTKKNSGGCAVPRNVGLPFSRGEYIFFMDSDDLITPTALEELYTQAKKFDADVVQCEKFYQASDEILDNAELRKNLRPCNHFTGEKILITEPLVWENNFEERIKFLSPRKLNWVIWNHLIRRDFIADNEIRFCNSFAEDVVFTFCELCSAKRYVLIPNVVYYYRLTESSLTRGKNDLSKLLTRQVIALKEGIKYIDDFLRNREFFSRRPDLKYILFDTFANEMFDYVMEIYMQVPAFALDDLLQKEFSDGNSKALSTFLFSMVNSYRLQLIHAHQRISQLENEIKSLKAAKK